MLYIKDGRVLFIKFMDTTEDLFFLLEDELIEVVDFIKMYTNKDVLMSKYQAFNYIHVSRATFDNLVKEGKIPQGIKQQGFTEKAWLKKDLDEYLRNKRNY